MADKKRYYKLDDIGFVGKQEKKSASSESYRAKKTGEVFHHARSASSARQPRRLSRAS